MSDLRIAVLGVGMMGAFHVDALTRRVRGAEVSVINDSFPKKAQQVAAQVGARAVGDPIEAINDPDIDAVLLATPGAAHAQQVNACLDRGVPVLCEKPLTTDVSSAYAIVQKEAALGRRLVQVGFMMRDSVVHEVDAVRFLLDEEITSVQVIKGAATRIAPEGTNDPMLVIFQTESGRLVTDEIYVRTQVAYEVRTEVVGEKGSAFIGLDQNLQLKTTEGRWGGQLTRSFVERFGAAYQTELQRWVDAAKAGTVDGPGAWDGFAAVAV